MGLVEIRADKKVEFVFLGDRSLLVALGTPLFLARSTISHCYKILLKLFGLNSPEYPAYLGDGELA